MDDAPTPDEPLDAPLDVAAERTADVPPDVALVIPAPAYESLDTDAFAGAPPAPAVPAALDRTPEVLAAVEALAVALGKRLDTLNASFDREIRAEATREKVVDRLHAELQEYKQDLLLNVLRPVFVDLIQLHDDMGKMAAAHGEGGPVEPAKVASLLGSLQQGIEDILYRQGVEPFAVDTDAFDPRRQRAVQTVPTADPEQARRVAARHRKGFQAGEKVIRPEIVSVYTHRPGP